MSGIRRPLRGEDRLARLEAMLEQHHVDIQRLLKRQQTIPEQGQGVLPGWSAICIGPCSDPPEPTPTPAP